MNNETLPDQNSQPYCDNSIVERRGFISVGSCLSVVGCVSNLLLLYVFLCKTGRAYPFQTLLAILDFMLCGLYIECFGFHLLSVDYELGALYHFVLDNSVLSLALSRMVQFLIPYTLIANSADKLAMIYGKDGNSKQAFHLRLMGIVLLIITAILLRVNTFYSTKVLTTPNCTEFQSRWMAKEESSDPFYIRINDLYERGLTFFNTFVSFVVLFSLNSFIVWKLRAEHRNTRRQSTSPAQLFSTSVTRLQVAQTVREQQSQLRCAVKTTVVIISAYLACNSLNFACYIWETTELAFQEDGSYTTVYLILCDIASTLFVVSSSVRIFIYYKFNTDMRNHIKEISFIKFFIPNDKAKTDALLKVDL